MSLDHALLYIRELPGGGFVSIESRPAGGDTPFHATLCVERRSDPDRRDGHVPPIVLTADGATQSEAFDRLLAVANNNVAVAAALLRWQAERSGGLRDAL